MKKRSLRKSFKRNTPSRPRKAKAGGAASHSSGKIIVRYRPRKVKTFDKGKGATPKRVLKLVAKARQYKKGRKWTGAQTKAYNKKLRAEMKAANYPPNTIEAAVNDYSMRQKVRIMGYARAWKHVEKKYFKKVKGKYVIAAVKYKGKKIPMARFKSAIRIQKYNAVIKSYRDRFGLNMKEAQELYRGLRDEKWGQKVFRAVY